MNTVQSADHRIDSDPGIVLVVQDSGAAWFRRDDNDVLQQHHVLYRSGSPIPVTFPWPATSRTVSVDGKPHRVQLILDSSRDEISSSLEPLPVNFLAAALRKWCLVRTASRTAAGAEIQSVSGLNSDLCISALQDAVTPDGDVWLQQLQHDGVLVNSVSSSVRILSRLVYPTFDIVLLIIGLPGAQRHLLCMGGIAVFNRVVIAESSTQRARALAETMAYLMGRARCIA